MGTGGGDKRDRTADLLHAMQALSQLSYTPTGSVGLLFDRDANYTDELFFCQYGGSKKN